MDQIRILSVNVSRLTGTSKEPVECIVLNPIGIEGDAHAGRWHRQVSLLGIESLEKMQSVTGRKFHYGEFAENLTTAGFPLFRMHPLDRLVAGEVELEVTQIGKKCHGEKCAIFRETGDCIMPKEGIFCRVIRGGRLCPGEVMEYRPKVMKVRVITLSDRASRGEYTDRSGPALAEMVEAFFLEAGRQVEVEKVIIPDDADRLKSLILDYCSGNADIIFTTGGTGIGPRDITPDVIKPLLDKEIPGIMEMIRVKYGMQFPNALVSRSVAGVISGTLVYTLPGSPKAAVEYTGEILKTMEHSLRMLHEIDWH